MTPTRWQRVQDLVNAALDLPEQERASFLNDACGTNGELRHQIEGLIHSYEQSGDTIEQAFEGSVFDALTRDTPLQGDRIGVYEIIEVIGRGGMGTVYLARRVDDEFRQQVAIKVLLAGLGASPELLNRFRAERQILATLTHSNIANLIDGGVTECGLPYLVMEYIDGTAINYFIDEHSLTIRDRLELFRQVCSAIQYAHQNLIVHRDIKPANILVTHEATPKLLDFGIAKLLSPESLGQTVPFTRPADRLMTPEYASPEQIRGETITTATDVYSLGVLLYELLTGKRPFRTANLTPASIERLICETSPEAPSAVAAKATASIESISTDLDHIVSRAMHKDPVCRYPSAAALSEDIRRYIEGFPIAARVDSWRYRTRKFVLRNKVATAAAVLVAVTISALSIGLAGQAARAKQEAQTADQIATFLGGLFQNLSPDKPYARSSSMRDILDAGAKRVSSELSSQPLTEARLLNILGSTYHELGALDRADALLTQGLAIRTKVLGPNSEEVAESLEKVAQNASDRGNFDRATKADEKALAIYTRLKGRNSAQVAQILNDIGEQRWMLGDLEGAKQRFYEAIAISSAVKGQTDVQTLNTKNDLAAVLANQGDYEAAEPLARDVLATEVRLMGENNPTVALSLGNLAFILTQTAHFVEAEGLARRCLELRQKVDGQDHPTVALAFTDLGALARELGNYHDAQRFGERSLRMATMLEGPHSLGTAASQGQLGLTMLAKRDFVRARELLESSLATRLALGNPDNPDLGDNYDRVGLLDLEVNNLSAASSNIERGLQIRQKYFGRENANVARSLNHLARVRAAVGDYSTAESTYREAIALARRKFKAAHTITAEGLFGLGEVLMNEGRIKEAKAALRESLALRRNLLPPTHPDIKASTVMLQKCETLTGQTPE